MMYAILLNDPCLTHTLSAQSHAFLSSGDSGGGSGKTALTTAKARGRLQFWPILLAQVLDLLMRKSAEPVAVSIPGECYPLSKCHTHAPSGTRGGVAVSETPDQVVHRVQRFQGTSVETD